jgi:hypothetical protein
MKTTSHLIYISHKSIHEQATINNPQKEMRVYVIFLRAFLWHGDERPRGARRGEPVGPEHLPDICKKDV